MNKFVIAIVVILLSVSTIGCGRTSNEVYRIARDPTWYPLWLLGKEKNVLAFSDELLAEVAEKEEISISVVTAGHNTVEAGLDNGEFDAAMTTLEPTAYRVDKYLFSDPYFLAGPILVVGKSSPVASLEDMRGRTVAVRTEALETFHLDGHSDVIFKFYESVARGLDALIRGEIDGVIMDLVPAYEYARGVYSEQIKVVGAPLTTMGLRLVASRERAPDLVPMFNEALAELREEGTYQELLTRWGLTNPAMIPKTNTETSEAIRYSW